MFVVFRFAIESDENAKQTNGNDEENIQNKLCVSECAQR